MKMFPVISAAVKNGATRLTVTSGELRQIILNMMHLDGPVAETSRIK